MLGRYLLPLLTRAIRMKRTSSAPRSVCIAARRCNLLDVSLLSPTLDRSLALPFRRLSAARPWWSRPRLAACAPMPFPSKCTDAIAGPVSACPFEISPQPLPETLKDERGLPPEGVAHQCCTSSAIPRASTTPGLPTCRRSPVFALSEGWEGEWRSRVGPVGARRDHSLQVLL